MGIAPQVAEFYKKEVATNKDIELILCSWDQSPAALSSYLSTAGSSYPTVLVLEAKKQKKSIPKLYKQFLTRVMGKGMVVDRAGNTIIDIEGRNKSEGDESEKLKAFTDHLRDLKAP